MSHIKEKQESEEPKRMKYAMAEIEKLGYKVIQFGITRLEFQFKEGLVKFYPYTGWATGKSIKDARGIKNLIKQIKTSKN